MLFVLGWALSCWACGDPSPPAVTAPRDRLAGLDPGSDAWVLAHAPLYVDGTAAERHAALEASLTSHDNGYATTRLGSYALAEGGWDGLPEWRPRSVRITERDLPALAAGTLPSIDEAPRLPDAPGSTDWAGWRALGERVFFELPLRGEPSLLTTLTDPVQRAALGLETAPEGSIPGVVAFRNVEGRTELGITCALCHAATEDGALVAGRARRALDFGRIRLAALERVGAVEDRLRERYLSWGPGRADVLEQISEVPIAIPDLWAMRDVRHFTQDGALTHVSPLTLAIRQETQFIQANHLATRPPRALMFALVIYLYSLTPPARGAMEIDEPTRSLGAATFARECGRCHGARGYTGDLVDAAEVGTDPELAMGAARGTGRYRPAPLIDVARAAPYFHHGVVPSLEALLSSERLSTPAMAGHAYGLTLSELEREALIGHLRTL